MLLFVHVDLAEWVSKNSDPVVIVGVQISGMSGGEISTAVPSTRGRVRIFLEQPLSMQIVH